MQNLAQNATDSDKFDPESVAGYIHVKALHYAMSDVADVEDLKQEGLIAAWQAIDSFKPEKGIPLKSWQMKAIDFAMFETRYRGTWTGMPPRSKNGGSSVKHKATLIDWSCADWASPGEFITEIINRHMVAHDHSTQAIWIYHHDELIKAIQTLTPDQQEYVFLRFWLDMKPRELKEFFPKYSNPDSLWFGDYGARAKLRRILNHINDN